MSYPGAAALNSSVLVLNQGFSALTIINAKRAFCMLARNNAEVVEESDGEYCSYNFESWQSVSEARQEFPREEDQFVATVSKKILIPRIIRLPRYNRPPRKVLKFNRRNLFARDGNRCQYCGVKFPISDLSLDHVVPRAQGGGTTWENVVCACLECNVRKGGRTPAQASMELIQKPHQPKTNPLVQNRLRDKRYFSWRAFLDEAYWSVELDD